MKAPKSINIAQGINPKKLINLLQNNEVLLLKGKKKTFKIQKDYIQIFQNQTLTLEQIPTHIPTNILGVQDIELSDLQKLVLIKNEHISVGKLKIRLNKNSLQLNIQRSVRQHEPVRVGGHKMR